MNDPQIIDIRRRIRELQAIPERDRTDEHWDELNELEIRTAPGNRESERAQEKLSEKHAIGRRAGRKSASKLAVNGSVSARAPQEVRAESGNRPPKRQHRRRRPVEVVGRS